MRIKYIGESFNMPIGLKNGKTYNCIGVEFGLLRVIDESEEEDGVLYSASNPRPLDDSSPGGKWKIIEDDEQGSLRMAIFDRLD